MARAIADIQGVMATAFEVLPMEEIMETLLDEFHEYRKDPRIQAFIDTIHKEFFP